MRWEDRVNETYSAKDSMLVVQPGSGDRGNEELAAIGVGAGVGHTQGEGAVMPQAAVKLVLELSSPDGCPSCAITCKDSGIDNQTGWLTYRLLELPTTDALGRLNDGSGRCN